MRCKACDCDLTDFESTRKSTALGDYIDLCSECFSTISPIMDTTENFILIDTTRDLEFGPILVSREESPNSDELVTDDDEPIL